MTDTTLDKYNGYYKGKNITSFIGYKGANIEAEKLIDQIWFTGSISAKEPSSSMRLHLNILLSDGNRKEFSSGDLSKRDAQELLEEADDWIESQIKK